METEIKVMLPVSQEVLWTASALQELGRNGLGPPTEPAEGISPANSLILAFWPPEL